MGIQVAWIPRRVRSCGGELCWDALPVGWECGGTWEVGGSFTSTTTHARLPGHTLAPPRPTPRSPRVQGDGLFSLLPPLLLLLLLLLGLVLVLLLLMVVGVGVLVGLGQGVGVWGREGWRECPGRGWGSVCGSSGRVCSLRRWRPCRTSSQQEVSGRSTTPTHLFFSQQYLQNYAVLSSQERCSWALHSRKEVHSERLTLSEVALPFLL